jgi:Na+/proline symporter
MLIRHKESHFWSSAGYGALAGTAVGVVVGLVSYEKPKSTGFSTLDFGPGATALAGGILGAVTGFTIGGIVGAVSGGDEKHDLSQEPTEEKIKILGELRKEIQ